MGGFGGGGIATSMIAGIGTFCLVCRWWILGVVRIVLGWRILWPRCVLPSTLGGCLGTSVVVGVSPTLGAPCVS